MQLLENNGSAASEGDLLQLQNLRQSQTNKDQVECQPIKFTRSSFRAREISQFWHKQYQYTKEQEIKKAQTYNIVQWEAFFHCYIQSFQVLRKDYSSNLPINEPNQKLPPDSSQVVVNIIQYPSQRKRILVIKPYKNGVISDFLVTPYTKPNSFFNVHRI